MTFKLSTSLVSFFYRQDPYKEKWTHRVQQICANEGDKTVMCGKPPLHSLIKSPSSSVIYKAFWVFFARFFLSSLDVILQKHIFSLRTFLGCARHNLISPSFECLSVVTHFLWLFYDTSWSELLNFGQSKEFRKLLSLVL